MRVIVQKLCFVYVVWDEMVWFDIVFFVGQMEVVEDDVFLVVFELNMFFWKVKKYILFYVLLMVFINGCVQG